MEISDVLRDSPQKVSEAWDDFQIAERDEKMAFANAYLQAKATGLSIEDAKQTAELDRDFESAFINRVGKEALYNKLKDQQINARKLAELAKGGL